MRFAVDITIPAPEGNAAYMSGKLGEAMKAFIDKWHPEAAYFFPRSGQRGATFYLNMDEAWQLPSLVEPFFVGMSAHIVVTPAMNFDDLKKGLAATDLGKH